VSLPAVVDAVVPRRLQGTSNADPQGNRYTTYRALLSIVTHHYRTHVGVDEVEARCRLSCALHELAAM